jgi:hypothetical protein
MVTDLVSRRMIAAARSDNTKVRGLSWYDENRLLVHYSLTSYPPFGLLGARTEWSFLVTWNVATGRMHSIRFHVPDVSTLNAVLGPIERRVVDGRPHLFVTGAYLGSHYVYPGLFDVDLRTDQTNLVARGSTHDAHWGVVAQGRVAASYEYRLRGDRQGHWVLRVRRHGAMRRVASGDAVLDPPYLVGFSADDRSLIVAFDTSRGWIWKPLQLAHDTWGAPLAAGMTFSDPIHNPLTGQILGGTVGSSNPRRVCIVGASYGGYAAPAGVSLQTGIYRCAVSVAGIADLAKFLDWTNQKMLANRNEFTRYWDRYLGVDGPKDPRLQAISPIDHLDAISVPVLLIHGRDDVVAPVLPKCGNGESAATGRQVGAADQLAARGSLAVSQRDARANARGRREFPRTERSRRLAGIARAGWRSSTPDRSPQPARGRDERSRPRVANAERISR